NDIILFKSPNLQEPLKTTPGWGYFYSDAYVDRFGIFANGSIYILGNGMYYKGGGGLFIWKISVNGNVLTDISSILPHSWTVPGNNMFWLTGAYGNGTLALAEDNFNQTECNIILIRNNTIVATIKDPLGYTGSNQQPSMAFADGQFLFLVQDNGKILAALISQDGSVTDVSSHFNYIQMINPDSDLLGIGKVFVIAAGSTYIFNPSTGDLISVNNPAQVGITSYFNSTCVLLGGVESQNFTVELMNLNDRSITKVFAVSNVPFLSSFSSLGALDMGFYNGTLLIAGPFLSRYGPINTVNLDDVKTANVTFVISPKNAWLTVDQCLCGSDMDQIALPLSNGTFWMNNAVYGEYYVYAQSPDYMDYFGVVDVNSSNQVIRINLKPGYINSSVSYPWFTVGPHDITIQFLNMQVAKYSAHIGLFAVDAGNSDVIYAASSVGPGMTGPIGDGGIYKTTNGGKTWFPVDLGLPFAPVTGLYINESDPEILLAGLSNYGIYMTTDGGGYWFKVSNFTDAIDIVNAGGKIFAGSDQGVIESTDSGYSWRLIEPTQYEVNSISISNTTIYALLNDLVLLKSTDLGQSWSEVYKFMGYYPYTVRASPFNSSIVYVTIGGGAVYVNSITIPTSVPTFYSDDGGRTFVPVVSLPVKTVVFDGQNSSVMWAVGYPDLYSFNGGRSFYATFLTVDNMEIYVDPANDSILLAGSDQGMFESNDRGISWYSISGNITDELSDAVSVSENGSMVLLSMQDLGTYMTYDGGGSWFPVSAGPENSLVYINPGNSSWVYDMDRGYASPIRVSNNGGLSFFQINGVYSPGYYTGNELFAVNSSNGKSVLLGTASGLYYSDNYGLNWTLVKGSPTDITALQYVDKNFMVVGTEQGVYVFNGSAWICSKGISGNVNSISVDPGNTSIVVASVGSSFGSDKLYLSINGGESFFIENTTLDQLFLYHVLYFPIPAQFFFLNTTGYPLVAITNYGVYLSTDLGKTWHDISYNLHSGQVDDLKFVDGNLYVATYGEGLQEIKNFSLSSLPGTLVVDIPANMQFYLNGREQPVYDGHQVFYLRPGTYRVSIQGQGYAKNETVDVKPMGVYYANLTAAVYFVENGLPSGYSWSVSFDGMLKSTSSTWIVFSNVTPGFHAYSVFLNASAFLKGYVAEPESGYVHDLNWPNESIYITFHTTETYNLTILEKGLPHGGLWHFVINVGSDAAPQASFEFSSEKSGISLMLPNGTYTFSDYAQGYYSYPASGTFSINGKPESITINFYYYELQNLSGLSSWARGWQANAYAGGNGFMITGDPLIYFNGKNFIEPAYQHEGFFISASWNGECFLLVGQRWAPGMGVFAGEYFPSNNSFVDLTPLFPPYLNRSAILRSVSWNGTVFLIMGDRLSSSSHGTTLLYEYVPSEGRLLNVSYLLPPNFREVIDCCGNPLEEVISIKGVFYTAIQSPEGFEMGRIVNGSFEQVNVNLSGFNLFNSNHDFMSYSNGSIYLYGTMQPGGPVVYMLNASTFSARVIFSSSNGQIVAGEPFAYGYAVSLQGNDFKDLCFVVNTSGSWIALNVTKVLPQSWNVVQAIFGYRDLYVLTELAGTNVEEAGLIPLFPAYYNVTFEEKGLPVGISWGLTLSNGQGFITNGSCITFEEPDGNYSYAIEPVQGYAVYPASGYFLVNGSSIALQVTFIPPVYSVTFVESGLPSGTIWSVTLNGA
ncbi:MAG: WD40/YVTN/BNR-like repeat-containing protein, partial [Nitrososphaeria archaeon]